MTPTPAPTFTIRDPRTKQVLFTGFVFLPEGMKVEVDKDNFYFMAGDVQLVTKEPCEIWNKVLELTEGDGTHMAFVKVGLHQHLENDSAGIPAWRLGFQLVDNLEVLDSIGIRGHD
jgi:hypothetical protein